MRVIPILLLATLIVSAATPVFAKNCTDRQRVCLLYCDKSYQQKGHEACRAACGNFMSVCQSTGCWESRVTAKECGFSKN